MYICWVLSVLWPTLKSILWNPVIFGLNVRNLSFDDSVTAKTLLELVMEELTSYANVQFVAAAPAADYCNDRVAFWYAPYWTLVILNFYVWSLIKSIPCVWVKLLNVYLKSYFWTSNVISFLINDENFIHHALLKPILFSAINLAYLSVKTVCGLYLKVS